MTSAWEWAMWIMAAVSYATVIWFLFFNGGGSPYE